MKKAIAHISVGKLIEMLKMPHGISLIAVEYPVDGNMKITLEGDMLPVDDINPNAKKLPEIDYVIQETWHRAKLDPKETFIEPETEPMPKRKYTKGVKKDARSEEIQE